MKSQTEMFTVLKCQPFKLFPLGFTSPIRTKGDTQLGDIKLMNNWHLAGYF